MNKKIRRAAAVLLALALTVSLVMFIRDRLERGRGEADYAAAQEIAGLAAVPDPVRAPETAGEPETLPEPVPEETEAAGLEALDLAALQAVNPDVAGWIEIPDTAVSYPLVQGEDNQYYLRRTWMKEDASMGSIFIECTNSRDMNDSHTIIYGHRMRSGTMFADLGKYRELDFWRDHPSVYIALEDGVRRYDIFAAYEAGLQSLVYRLDLDGREEELIRFGLDSSVIDTGVVPEAGEKLLTLSTCTGNGYSKRWVVQAVLREESVPET